MSTWVITSTLFTFHSSTGIGVYISRIEEASVAERSGLRPGDTILEVNGTPFSGMTHDEALTVNEMSFAFPFQMCMWNVSREKERTEKCSLK